MSPSKTSHAVRESAFCHRGGDGGSQAQDSDMDAERRSTPQSITRGWGSHQGGQRVTDKEEKRRLLTHPGSSLQQQQSE
jgi:hypothetical protein